MKIQALMRAIMNQNLQKKKLKKNCKKQYYTKNIRKKGIRDYINN